MDLLENPFTPFDGPLEKRPHNRAEVVKVFGDPTRGGLYQRVCDPEWQKRSIVDCWREDAIEGLERFDFMCHRLLEPYFREAFRRAFLVAPGYIDRAASFVFRHIRHDVKRPLSLHSWGIACDVNSDDNGGKYFKAPRPTPWSDEWLELWPNGVPAGVVAAFESCGFSWGGWWGKRPSAGDNYSDPMHFEWTGKTDVRV